MESKWQRRLEGSQFENEGLAPVILSQEHRKNGRAFYCLIRTQILVSILYIWALNYCMKSNEEA